MYVISYHLDGAQCDIVSLDGFVDSSQTLSINHVERTFPDWPLEQTLFSYHKSYVGKGLWEESTFLLPLPPPMRHNLISEKCGPKEPAVEDSCFGGLAIYSMVLSLAVYTGPPPPSLAWRTGMEGWGNSLESRDNPPKIGVNPLSKERNSRKYIWILT